MADSHKRNLLITGGAGFIGGNFVLHWAANFPDDRIVVFDALTYAGNVRTIETLIASDKVTFMQGDITDKSAVTRAFKQFDIDTVVHFAAESHVDRSIAEPDRFIHTNVLGTQVLLEAAREFWLNDGVWREGVRFHHVSTDEVYGSLLPTDAPFTEQTPYSPNSPYAASKAGSDHLVRAYVHTYGLPASISNCSNNYGPFQFPEKLIPLMIVNALHGKPLPVYGDGLQVRDWLFVEDHCRAIECMLNSNVHGTTFNVGGRAEHRNIEIVHQICALIDARFASDESLASTYPDCPAAQGIPTTILIAHVKDRPGHDRRYAIDPTLIATQLGFEPAKSLNTGLARTVDWYLSNREWWSAILDGSYRDWIEKQYGSN